MEIEALFLNTEQGAAIKSLFDLPIQREWNNNPNGNLLKKLIWSSQSIYYLYNIREGVLYFPNNRLEEILGYKDGALNPLSRHSLAQVMHPQDYTMHLQLLESLVNLDDGQWYESEYRMKTIANTWKWFSGKEMVYQRDEYGQVKTIFGVASDVTRAKQTEDKIRESRTKLLAVFESTEDAIFSIDNTFCIINMNNAYKESFKRNYGVYPAKGSPVFKDVPRENSDFFKPLFQKAFRGERQNIEYSTKINSEVSYYEVSINPAFIENEVAFLTCFSKNVTALRKNEQETRKQKNLLQSIIESTTHSVFAFDTQLRYLAFNVHHFKTMKRIYGVDIEVGKSIKDILENIPEEKKDYGSFERALNGEEFTYIEKYGLDTLECDYFEITFSPMRDETDVITGICVFSHNISDRIEAERQQLLAEKKFGEIFENSPDAVYVEDGAGNILDINKAACELQGLDKDYLRGINIRHLVPREHYTKVMRDYKKLYLGTLHSIESFVWSKVRGSVPVEITGKKIHYEDKPALLLQVRDITERRKMEAERLLIEQEKMKQKEEILRASLMIKEEERNRIAAEIHDDIGSGLSKISVLCQVIKKCTDDTETVSAGIDKILQSSKEVQESINEIIWAMNPQNDKLENLIAYIHYYASEFLETNQLRFKIGLPEMIPSLTVIGKIRRNIFLVFKESLNNIAKYAKTGEVTISLSYENDRLTICVKDTGPGFDLKQVQRFKNGINNMKRRMEDINGEYFIESAPGKGTHIKAVVAIPAS
jgi:PAS domain S-box-containing protein